MIPIEAGIPIPPPSRRSSGKSNGCTADLRRLAFEGRVGDSMALPVPITRARCYANAAGLCGLFTYRSTATGCRVWLTGLPRERAR